MHACKEEIQGTSHEITCIDSSLVIDKVVPHKKVPKREGFTLGALQQPNEFIFFISVLLRLNHHNSVVIVFFVFLFVFEPSKTFMTSLGDGCLILLEKDKNFLLTRLFFIFIQKEILSFFASR